MNAAMMRRLEALEAQRGQEQSRLSIRRIIIAPVDGKAQQLPVKGWRSTSPPGMSGPDIETTREPGESEEACWERHDKAIEAAYGPKAVTMSVQVTE